MKALSCVCLSLSAGDLVTVMRRGEHHKESPMDDWPGPPGTTAKKMRGLPVFSPCKNPVGFFEGEIM